MSHDDTPACLRCWEHEDCLEHPELAVACAAAEDRRVYPIHHHGAAPAGPDGGAWRSDEWLNSEGSGDGKYMTDGINFPPGDGGGYGYDSHELSLTIRTDDFDTERMEGNYQRAIQNNCGSVG